MRTSSTALLACTGVAVLALVGCDERFPYCYGINETNMPSQLRIVEPALGAQRYRVGPDDLRVSDANDGFPSQKMAGCQNIDGFDQVETIRIHSVKRENNSYGGMRTCSALRLIGELEPHGERLLPLAKYVSSGFGAIGRGSLESVPSDIARFRPTSAVHISRMDLDLDAMWHYGKVPLERDILYAQELPNGAPPVIIKRVWKFDATPESADVMEQLGITTDTERATCVDYYYGYYLP